MARIVYLVYDKHMYMRGFVRWGRLVKEIQNYEKECVDFLLLSNGRGKGLVCDIFSNLGIVEGKM